MPQQPTDEKIAQLKAQYADRQLFLVEAVDGEGETEDLSMVCVMTAPERGEYKMFVEAMFKAGDSTKGADKIWATRNAIEIAALAQIRWPSREECMTAFRLRPAMIDGFAEELKKAAGEQTIVRSKKL